MWKYSDESRPKRRLQLGKRKQPTGAIERNLYSPFIYIAEWSSPVARQIHVLKVVGPNPASAINSGKSIIATVRQDLKTELTVREDYNRRSDYGKN